MKYCFIFFILFSNAAMANRWQMVEDAGISYRRLMADLRITDFKDCSVEKNDPDTELIKHSDDTDILFNLKYFNHEAYGIQGRRHWKEGHGIFEALEDDGSITTKLKTQAAGPFESILVAFRRPNNRLARVVELECPIAEEFRASWYNRFQMAYESNCKIKVACFAK